MWDSGLRSSSNVGVAAVRIRLNNGAWQLATGTTTWWGNVTLISGLNTIDVSAVDASGNQTLVTRTISYNSSDDDHGSSIATASWIPPNSNSMAGILTAGDEDFFRVTVPGPGFLITWTVGTTDTYGYLYDSSGNGLDDDDDANLGYNFRMSSSVVAGNYFIRVKGFNSSTVGAYTVCTRFIPSTDPIHISYLERDLSAVNIGFTSIAGAAYDIQASGDLKIWTTVSTASGTGAENYVTLTGQGSQPKRFFRVSNAPPTSTGFALIPGGTFQMGDQSSPLVGASDELPVHAVQVSAFHMAKYEVTKAEWDATRTWGLANGYTDLSVGGGKAANHPAHTITWYSMLKWCNARSQQEGLTPCYTLAGATYKIGNSDEVVCNWSANGYRLPTEAEWEKAARGGLSAKNFPWGNTITHSQANYFVYSTNGTTNYYSYDVSPTLGYHPSYNDGTSPYTSPVGSLAPNGYGLCDMAGNLHEWCWDSYVPYVAGTQNDPRVSNAGSYRVRRGGYWGNNAVGCRVAARLDGRPGSEYTTIGFRVARSSIP